MKGLHQQVDTFVYFSFSAKYVCVVKKNKNCDEKRILAIISVLQK
jgi:hypothetical protein